MIWLVSLKHIKIKFYVEDKIMSEKTGMLVYPTMYKDTPNDIRCIELFGKGVFFTDSDEGWKYQEEMNQKDNNKNVFWSNNIIPYK